jgi:hypothetical protein
MEGSNMSQKIVVTEAPVRLEAVRDWTPEGKESGVEFSMTALLVTLEVSLQPKGCLVTAWNGAFEGPEVLRFVVLIELTICKEAPRTESTNVI